MNSIDEAPRSFSVIADYKGDLNVLFNEPHASSLPAMPLRNMMLFPGVVTSVTVTRESSLAVAKKSLEKSTRIAILAQKDNDVDDPNMEDLYEEGVVGRVVRMMPTPDGKIVAIIHGFGAIRVERIKRHRPVLRVEVSHVDETVADDSDKEFHAIVSNCREMLLKFVRLNGMPHAEEVEMVIENMTHPTLIINYMCTNLPFEQDERAELFALHDVKLRAMKLLQLFDRQMRYAELKHNIQERTREELDQQQKEYFLKQQIQNIKSELGEEGNKDVTELEGQAKLCQFPDKIRAHFDRELERLAHTSLQSPDYNVMLTYLQTIVRLPWGICTDDNLNIRNAQRVLSRDHYGMEKVKERILEHLATLRFRTSHKAPILCLYGPPGVGKTSLGRSIAEALGRKYVRMSLGGVHDEAEIRGHRRTYVGAMPGRIIKGLMKAGSANPLFVLDEIDKVSSGNYNGDPYSALLEVLDPEQNNAFHDNYLDIDFDLSKVFFIATANSLQTIPRPLLDRMEIIELEGYLAEEKREIARKHLIPKEKHAYDFGEGNDVKFQTAAIDAIIEHYTRESGVRQLEKQIDKVFRKISFLTSTSEDQQMPFAGHAIKPSDLTELLGKPIFNRDKYQGNRYPGVVTGLAWTSVGGEILFIETSVSRSKGAKLTLTGNLGDVMKESAVLALEYVKANADKLNIDYRVFDHWSVHIHVPEGATPKDGPSAGITIATSIASALTQRRVRDHVAMTGEITLRGRVLPVGGIKEKILAAKRAGITDIVMSEENRRDIDEINPTYVRGLKFHFVKEVHEVFDFALLEEKVENAIDLQAALTEEAAQATHSSSEA